MRLALPLSVLAFCLSAPVVAAQEAVGASMWRAEARDNICGLSNLRHVTNPAVVDYKDLLNATPEMKDLKDRGIDPRSAEGQILRQRAVDHVRRVGSKVMRKSGNCSMWKAIAHRDGRKIKDLTHQVVSALSMSTVSMNAAPGEVFAADPGGAQAPAPGSSWPIPALMGLALAAGWYGARKRSAARGVSGTTDDA